jgi:polar amino acid transport system substrate-binding protein
MRKPLLLSLGLIALLGAACTSGGGASPNASAAATAASSAAPSVGASTAPSAAPSASAAAACAKADLALVTPGTFTIGTDNPAYPPWYGGDAGHGWKVADPTSGKGFESAVAYAVAAKLGFTRAQVSWTYVPFVKSYAPGPKSFDFDINQISYTAARAKVVTFSSSYYDVNQAIVVLKGSPISKVRTVAGLAKYKLGAELGTTSYGYIQSHVKPSQKAAVFPNDAGATLALKNKQIDGLVVDLPTAFYITGAELSNANELQFPSVSGGEHFGMVFQKDNGLASCVNSAIASLKQSGTLAKIQQQWLAKATGAPVLK